jgi:IclR family transcriptional regulator, KDG regulon repressor
MNSIEKSIEILNYLSNSKKSVRIVDVCKDVDLKKSTVHRIFNILVNYSLVNKEEDTAKYGLGLKVLEYANSFYDSFDFRKNTNSILRKICLEIDLTTYLTAWYNDRIICIDVIRPSHIINTNFSVDIGKEMPFHCTSSSKIILAYQSPEKIKSIIYKEPLKKYTPNTIVDPKQLIVHLNEIKNKGFAICDEELEKGVKGIAVPIKNINEKVIGSIAVVGLFNRISNKNIKNLTEILINSSKQLSRLLWYKEKFY